METSIYKTKKLSVIRWLQLILILGWFSGSCAPKADTSTTTDPSTDTPAADCMISGDILVTNSGSSAVVLLDTDGNFKRVVYNVNNSEKIYGINWLSGNSEFIIAIDGVDRVVAVSKTDCSSRDYIVDSNLNGNLRGITQVSNGDILIVETDNIERFTSTGLRINSSGWPKALQTGGTQLSAIPAGGFVQCSLTADVVRTYNDAGTQLATKASGIAATTDGVGCIVMANGNIATAWSGTTDSVAIYNSSFTTTVATYSNLGVLAAPGGIAQRANGNLLVLDRTFNYIVELTSAGTFVNVIGDGVLSTPEFISVVP